MAVPMLIPRITTSLNRLAPVGGPVANPCGKLPKEIKLPIDATPHPSQSRTPLHIRLACHVGRLKHSLTRAMEFAALRIPLWDDGEDLDSDVEFWRSRTPAGVGSIVASTYKKSAT